MFIYLPIFVIFFQVPMSLCSVNMLGFNCAFVHVSFARYLLYQYIVDITEMLHFRFIDSYPVARSIKCFASFYINTLYLFNSYKEKIYFLSFEKKKKTLTHYKRKVFSTIV